MHYISTKQKARTGPHFAAFIFSTVGELKVSEYIAFDSRDEMERWVSQQEKEYRLSRKDYQVVEVKPLAVEVKTSVSIG